MKTKSILTVILALVITAFNCKFALADNGINETQKIISVKAAMESLKYPEFAIKENLKGEVVVSFKVDEDGKIVIKEINGTYPEFVTYVEKQLQKIVLDYCALDVETKYYYNFKFELI